MQVRPLGQEDPLEKGMVTHSSILAWKTPRTGYSPWGPKELDTTDGLHFLFFSHSKTLIKLSVLSSKSAL